MDEEDNWAGFGAEGCEADCTVIGKGEGLVARLFVDLEKGRSEVAEERLLF